MPQAATTIATAVETLRLWLPSPPVPQTSIAPAGAAIDTIRVRISRAAAATSSTASPRSLSTIGKDRLASSGTLPSRLAAHYSAHASAERSDDRGGGTAG